MCSERPTRSNNRRSIIINYLATYAVLGDLADSVKPAGKLKNTIAEIGIYVLNSKKTRGASRVVMPLYVLTLLQNHQTGMAVVNQAFKKKTNHLDHRQLIFFPVLQKLVEDNEHSGHYFLIVLNLRNKSVMWGQVYTRRRRARDVRRDVERAERVAQEQAEPAPRG